MTTTHLAHLFSKEDLQSAIDDGYVSVQTHPSLPLVIYNYTNAAQYDRAWTPVTTQCRGLIADLDGYIVARPFGKFFNYGETDQYGELPKGAPIVSEKMDGSLGVIWTYEGHTAVATRGSFTSEQALWATEHLHNTYPNFEQPDDVTTLCEIVYPANRIVVDYGTQKGLWLLGAIYNPTGEDIDANKIDWWFGPTAKVYTYLQSLERAVAAAQGPAFDDGEGVVLCWPQHKAPAFRLKAKNPRYVEYHRIVTGLSTRTVWESIAGISPTSFDELIENVPDEFHPWIRNVAGALREEYLEIARTAEVDLLTARLSVGGEYGRYSRKDLAEVIKKSQYPGLCFALEDGKNIDSRVWDMVKPEREMAMILEDNG